MARIVRRLRLYGEMVVLSLMWPVGSAAVLYACYRGIMWSFGGRDNFRKIVLREPMEGEWFDVNPRGIAYRDAPLSAVPEHITAKPTGDVEGHRHHQNW